MISKLWYNSKNTVEGKPILYNRYFEKGIVFIQDLIGEYGHFMNYDTFRIKYNLKTKFLEYAYLLNAVKVFCNIVKTKVNQINPVTNNPKILQFTFFQI